MALAGEVVMDSLPECCHATGDEPLAKQLYAAYNRGGARPGLNYQNLPCPRWEDLPPDVRAKWAAVADIATGDFGWAIAALRAGHRVRRAGWNGKGMWLALTPGSEIPQSAARAGAAQHLAEEMGGGRAEIRIGAHIDMRAADGTLVIGWLASQTDMLAEDWEIVP